MERPKTKAPTEEIERIADEDGDTSQFFSKQGELRNGVTMKRRQVQAVRRNIDYSPQMFQRLNRASDELNVPSQAIVKLAIQDWLDRRDLAAAGSSAKATKPDAEPTLNDDGPRRSATR